MSAAGPAPHTVPAAPPREPVYNARELVDENTATILLDGQRYTLRITRSGKLILTK